MATRNRVRKHSPVNADGSVRVAIYTRRSTDDEHQPFSIDAQTTRLDAYVASQPEWQITARFTDDASGSTLDRPGLQHALRAAQAGRYDMLLVYRLDRLTRRIHDLAFLMEQLERVDIRFRSATEPFDTSSAAGRMLVQMLGVFAEFEREVLIDRTRNGMERKAAKGKWTGGTIPYGLQLDRERDIPVPHPTEATVVRQIFTTYAHDRIGTRAIADQLNQRGIRTRFGKPWSGTTIGNMLSNRVYLGDKIFGDVCVEDAHPAIISRELFEDVQRILILRGEEGSRRRAANSDYDLTGLITCPDCGLKYIGTAATGRSRSYRYYTCYSRVRYGRHGCSGPRLPADELDDAVLAALVGLYADSTLIDEAVAAERRFRSQRHRAARDELAAVVSEQKATRDSLERYLDAFEQGQLPAEECASRVRALRARLEQLAWRKGDLEYAMTEEPTGPSEQAIQRMRAQLADVVRHGTPGQRKALIEAHLAEITLAEGEIIPLFRVPQKAKEPLDLPSGSSTTVRAMPTVAPRLGLEPRTCRLTAGCSAN